MIEATGAVASSRRSLRVKRLIAHVASEATVRSSVEQASTGTHAVQHDFA